MELLATDNTCTTQTADYCLLLYAIIISQPYKLIPQP